MKIDPLTFLDNMHYFPDVVKKYYIPDDATFASMEKDVLETFMKTCEKEREQIVNHFKQMIIDEYFELNPEGTLTKEIMMKLTLQFIRDDIVYYENERFFSRKKVEKYIGNVDHKFLMQLVIDDILNEWGDIYVSNL